MDFLIYLIVAILIIREKMNKEKECLERAVEAQQEIRQPT